MSATVCSGSGVVVEEPFDDEGTPCHPCPVCWWWREVEPVEPEGTTPRWKIVDHQEPAS